MPRSIRGRVLLLAMSAQLLAISCAVGLSVMYVHRALWSSLDSDLRTRMVRLLALVGQDEQNPQKLEFDSGQVQIPPGDIFTIQDAQGRTLASSADWPENRPQPKSGAWTFVRNGLEYRATGLWNAPILDQEDMQVPPLRVTLLYAIPATSTQIQIAKATRMVVLVGAFALLLSACLTWWAVGRGMRPLLDLAARADRIHPDRADFEEPEDISRTTELIPLARALSSLASRVRQAFDRERRFLSDAAHELKTSVAIQKSTLQLLEHGNPTNEEYRDGLAKALEDSARIEHLVRDMLLLSSLEHKRSALPVATAAAPVQLSETIMAALEQLAPMARMRSVEFQFGSPVDGFITATAPELALLWTNLLENAIQHSQPGSSVVIDTEQCESSFVVRVVDTGEGISCVDLPHVFDRFYRADPSRSRARGGFGLGLSIAKAVVDRLGGTIRISSVPDAGTTVEVLLPCTKEAFRIQPEAAAPRAEGKS